MFFLSFPVWPIVVDVKVRTRCREGGVTQIIADQPQIHLLIGHVGTRAMPKPVGGRLRKAAGPLFIWFATCTQAVRRAPGNLLDEPVERGACQRLACHSDGPHRGRTLAG
jgi:hypothetical protein